MATQPPFDPAALPRSPADEETAVRSRLAALPPSRPSPAAVPAPRPAAPPWAALVGAQNAARKRYAPTLPPHRRTFCNESVCAIARGVKASPAEMAPLIDAHGDPLLANQMAQNLATSPAYQRVSPQQAQDHANAGGLVIATIPGAGHVTTVRPTGVPGDQVRPNSRGTLLNDIGAHDRVEGGNWAFPKSDFNEIQYFAARPASSSRPAAAPTPSTASRGGGRQ